MEVTDYYHTLAEAAIFNIFRLRLGKTYELTEDDVSRKRKHVRDLWKTFVILDI